MWHSTLNMSHFQLPEITLSQKYLQFILKQSNSRKIDKTHKYNNAQMIM